MTRKDRLSDYRAKRDTRKSGEPSGRRSKARRGRPVFVVQRHDASTLHFDFRIQIGDVLASWAVPKGPSLDPRDKRLATRTEDHPLDYADFEGRIDEGYGAGTVVVWDTGEFENLTEREGDPVDPEEAIEQGAVRRSRRRRHHTERRTRTGTRSRQWPGRAGRR